MIQSDMDRLKDIIDSGANSGVVLSYASLYTPTPILFLRNPDLTIEEKIMYQYLWGFGIEKMQSYPSQARMINDLGIGKNKVIRILKSLELKGGVYIINRFKKGTKEKTTNLYCLIPIDNKTGGFEDGYMNALQTLYPSKQIFI